MPPSEHSPQSVVTEPTVPNPVNAPILVKLMASNLPLAESCRRTAA